MFGDMEEKLLTWKEILSDYRKGQKAEIDPKHSSAIYSAIRDLKQIDKSKKFGIRTDPRTQKKHVIRIK